MFEAIRPANTRSHFTNEPHAIDKLSQRDEAPSRNKYIYIYQHVALNSRLKKPLCDRRNQSTCDKNPHSFLPKTIGQDNNFT